MLWNWWSTCSKRLPELLTELKIYYYQLESVHCLSALRPSSASSSPGWPAWQGTPALRANQRSVLSLSTNQMPELPESHVDTVFRITVDHDLENEMMVLSCKVVKICIWGSSRGYFRGTWRGSWRTWKGTCYQAQVRYRSGWGNSSNLIL